MQGYVQVLHGKDESSYSGTYKSDVGSRDAQLLFIVIYINFFFIFSLMNDKVRRETERSRREKNILKDHYTLVASNAHDR